jgi:toxin-antitoxin system PIN domain toxin
VILPDVNLLIHAHDTAARRHEAAKRWWDDALSGDEPVALAWVTLLGFIRLTTSRVVFQQPFSVDEAVQRVESWLAQPNVRLVHPEHRHAQLCFGFLRAAGTGGNLTTDAHLAALAVEHGCILCSTDSDFDRFAGLTWRNPLSEAARR